MVHGTYLKSCMVMIYYVYNVGMLLITSAVVTLIIGNSKLLLSYS